MDMAGVYRLYLRGELGLEQAAELLRSHAATWNAAPGSLELDTLPDEQRAKASELLDAAVGPIVAPYLAGEIGSEAAPRQLAPLMFPLGVFALNLSLPPGPDSENVMARLVELTTRLANYKVAPDGPA